MTRLGGRTVARAKRLAAIRELLRQQALSTMEIGEHFDVSQRTIQDDLRLLGASRGIKLVRVWEVRFGV